MSLALALRTPTTVAAVARPGRALVVQDRSVAVAPVAPVAPLSIDQPVIVIQQLVIELVAPVVHALPAGDSGPRGGTRRALAAYAAADAVTGPRPVLAIA